MQSLCEYHPVLFHFPPLSSSFSLRHSPSHPLFAHALHVREATAAFQQPSALTVPNTCPPPFNLVFCSICPIRLKPGHRHYRDVGIGHTERHTWLWL